MLKFGILGLTVLVLTKFENVYSGCRPLVAGPGDEIVHTYSISEDDTYPVMAVAFVTCADSREYVITCQPSGEWDQNIQPCNEGPNGEVCELTDEVMCPNPGEGIRAHRLKRKKKYCGSDFAVNETVSHRCYNGYVFANDQTTHTATCLANGRWNSELHICYEDREKSLKCEDPGFIPHADRSPEVTMSHYEPGYEVLYQCREGYAVSETLDQAIITCQENGQWDLELPSCHEFTCPRPRAPLNGHISVAYQGKKEFNVGESISFYCKRGYKRIGPRKLRCTQSLLGWSDILPTCQEREYVYQTSTRLPLTNPTLKSTPRFVDFTDRPSYEVTTGRPSKTETTEWQSNKETTSWPRNKETTGWPSYTETTVMPINIETTGMPINKGTTDWPSNKETTDWPSNKETTDWPSNKETTDWPSNKETTDWPSNKETTDWPSNKETTDGPSTVDTTTEFTCPRPMAPLNGRIYRAYWYKQEFNVGEIISFYCNRGYKRIGPRKLRCTQSLLGWSDLLPTCQEISSIVTEDYANRETPDGEELKGPGRHVTKSTTEPIKNESTDPWTTQLTYVTGSTRANSHSAESTTAGRWEVHQSTNRPTHIPDITTDSPDSKHNRTSTTPPEKERKILCKAPEKIDHGDFEPLFLKSRSFFVSGDEILYKCNTNYILKSSPFESEDGIRVCQRNGTWSKDKPKCIKRGAMICSDPGMVYHSKRIPAEIPSDGMFASGETVQYVCDRGYLVDDLFEETVLRCQENGAWDQDVPVCNEFYCKRPATPVRGSLAPENKELFKPGDTVTFSCETDYELRGPKTAKCIHDLQGWDGWVPQCKLKSCPMPPNLENGRRNGNDFRVGRSVQFFCNGNSKLIGSANRTCLPNKKWSGTLPVCDLEGTDCLVLGIPAGGSKWGNSYKHRDEVTFSCGSDFQLMGSERRVCLPNNKWSGQDAYCEYKYSFTSIEEGTVHIGTAIDNLATESSSSIDVHSLYEKSCLNENTGAINLYLIFDISGSIDEHQLDVVKNFSKVLINKLGVSEKGTNVGIIEFSYGTTWRLQLDARNTIQDVIRGIDSVIVSGGATATSDALKAIKTAMDVESNRPSRPWAKNVLFLLTDGKHNYRGNPVPIADELKKRPYNAEIYCVGVGGAVDKFSLRALASDENKFWVMETRDDLEAITDNISFRKIEYGLTYVPENVPYLGSASDHDVTAWPWVATLYVVDNNAKCDVDRLKYLCVATIIDKAWLITAKSCLEAEAYPWWRMRAKVGGLGEENVGIFIEVSQVFIHKNADQALVKLQQQLIFSPKIRAVKLPRENDNPFLDTWGSSLGFTASESSSGFPGVIGPQAHPRMNDSPIRYCQTMMNTIDIRQCEHHTPKSVLFTRTRSLCAAQSIGNDCVCVLTKGSPYMTQSDNGQVMLYGVLSWESDCVHFYSRVSAREVQTLVIADSRNAGLYWKTMR